MYMYLVCTSGDVLRSGVFPDIICFWIALVCSELLANHISCKTIHDTVGSHL